MMTLYSKNKQMKKNNTMEQNNRKNESQDGIRNRVKKITDDLRHMDIPENIVMVIKACLTVCADLVLDGISHHPKGSFSPDGEWTYKWEAWRAEDREVKVRAEIVRNRKNKTL